MYRRYDMIGAINLYGMKNGLHFYYVEKLRKSQLEEIIIKYNINVDELLAEKAEESKKMANFIPDLKEKFTQAVNKGLEGFKSRIEMLESLLNEEQKEKYEKYCISQLSNL